jgi:E1A-binding protein p400
VHWEHLLEEMRWLAGDFVRERKFRAKLARKAAYAVARSNLDLESRVIKRAHDEHANQRKVARHVANEIMHFWIKVEKVVRFKAQSTIDSKRKQVMDKHLDFMLGQTERYSTMLATKLVRGGVDADSDAGGGGGGGEDKSKDAAEDAAEPSGNDNGDLSLVGGRQVSTGQPISIGGRGSEVDEEEYTVADEDMEEDDEVYINSNSCTPELMQYTRLPLNSKPYALHPILYTLYSIPCIPHPVPDVSNEMDNVFHDREGVCPMDTMRNLAEV